MIHVLTRTSIYNFKANTTGFYISESDQLYTSKNPNTPQTRLKRIKIYTIPELHNSGNKGMAIQEHFRSTD